MPIKKITLYGLLLAIIFVVTIVIKIPAVNQMGYLNLSDVLVIIFVTLFPKREVAFLVGFGTSLADLFLGYGAYAPFTFLIKATEGLIIIYYLNKSKQESNLKYYLWVSFGLIFMVIAYGFTDAFIFASWPYFYVSILFNLNQAVVAFLIIIISKEPILKVLTYLEN